MKSCNCHLSTHNSAPIYHQPFTIRLFRIRVFGRDAIRRQRCRIHLLQLEMCVPDEFPLKPLAAYTLIPQLHADFIHIALDRLHTPLPKPHPLPALLHRAHMLIHRIQDRAGTDGAGGLHKCQRFRLALVLRRRGRRQLVPGIVTRPQHHHKNCRNANQPDEDRRWRRRLRIGTILSH